VTAARRRRTRAAAVELQRQAIEANLDDSLFQTQGFDAEGAAT
jgi:hypothetical protein